MDYYFYRIYSYWKKKNYFPVGMGILNVSWLQMLLAFIIFINVIYIIPRIFDVNFDFLRNKIWGFAVFITLIFRNIRYYVNKKNLKRILEKYKEHRLNKIIKNWMIIPLPLIAFLLSILIIKIINDLVPRG